MAEVFRIFRRDLTEDGICFLSEVLHTLLLKVGFLLCFLFQLLLSVLRESEFQYLVQYGLRLRDRPTSASQVLGLNVCPTMPGTVTLNSMCLMVFI